MSPGRGRLTAGLTAAGLLLVAAGLVAYFLQTPTETTVVPEAGPSSEGPASAVRAAKAPPREKRVTGAPRRVEIPTLGIDAPVFPIRSVGNTLVPPPDAQQLGWWADGARPGAGTGSALVTGHTINAGGGALDDLETLERGDRVTVRTVGGPVAYAVSRVRIYSKGAVADHAERIFSQQSPGRLVLITCEDWDGRIYLSNVVVTATPLSQGVGGRP